MDYNKVFSIDQIDIELVNWFSERKVGTVVGTVHSIFDKVINFMSADGSTLFSLAIVDVIQAPKMMKTFNKEQFCNTKTNLKPSMPIYLYDFKKLKIGSFLWDYSNATVWEENLNFPSQIEANLTNENLCLLESFIYKNGADGGMLTPWAMFNNQKDIVKSTQKNIYFELFFEQLKQLEREITKRQLSNSFYNFIGLGAGLTPSGDDFTTGVIATWKYYQFPLYAQIDNNKHLLLKQIEKRTTEVSYFMLKNCFAGFVNNALLQLIKNLDKEIENELWEVLNIGSTSGTDMLTGVSFAYRHLLNVQRR